MMTTKKLLTAVSVAAVVALTACGDRGADNAAQPETEAAKDAAGDQTIAAGLGDATKFAAAAKQAGLDATLTGPGPYTVLVPTDAAFDKLPAGALDILMKPEGRSDLTAVLTYHILPGTILAEDIGKAIDTGKGKTQLPTMAGGTLTATKEGDAIVLTDGAGTKAKLVNAEEKKSNGVIHRVDAVLMPSKA
jgi:uncharacterized surface protein with fasciclin (FAS1) repeats